MDNGWLKSLLKKFKLNESTISTVLGLLVIVVIGVLIFNYFRGVNESEEAQLQTEEEEMGEEGVEEVELIEEKGQLYPENLPTTHQVVRGEHLWAIAERYYGSGYNWVDIAKENKLANPNVLLVDQKLNIPKTAIIQSTAKGSVTGAKTVSSQYTVAKGDHLWGIAVKNYGDGYRWVEIAQANNLNNPNLIHPGNVLTLP